jgi:UMF1 family MFS transporter
MKRNELEKGSKKMLNAWAFYDWANSVYSLVISSAVFPIFYGALFRLYDVESVRVFGLDLERGVLISYVSSAAFVVIALATPMVSGIADYLGNKRLFPKVFLLSRSLVLYRFVLVLFRLHLLKLTFLFRRTRW